ncbi:flagellin N-terminal helical domain-containing protein [Amorphus orientalis]|uniref:Flagellin n=1 Tax=Amorphus orientalis TaxID=649198 RepID=A0AAE3VU11_9HYPH|nr:flagellin [Amorphus orientalis]MDQ0317601.1 flagellin [Amorphus orientalis]
MTSINTNTSAMVALQTLRSINNNLDETNNRVSTGLRVNSAADNAAYWSIATTTKSDNGALGAVKDALGLGSASVDTANTGLDTAREALQKIKEKLVTATAPETDKGKLQTEISSLLQGIRSTADSSVISGNNWLSVNNSGDTKDVVVSFSRTGSSIAVDTIQVNIDDFALYEDGTSTGIMDQSRRVANSEFTMSTLTGTPDMTGETVSFDFNGTEVQINAATVAAVGNNDNVVDSAAELAAVYDRAFADAGITGVTTQVDANGVRFSSTESFTVSNVTSVNTAGQAAALGLTNGSSTEAQFERTLGGLTGTPDMTGETLSFDVNGTTVTVDQTVMAGVGNADAVVDTVTELADAYQAALSNAGINNIDVRVDAATNNIVFGSNDEFTISNSRASTPANVGNLGMSDGEATITNGYDAGAVANIDITTASKGEIAGFLKIVDAALLDMTDASTKAGALTSRIESQESFVMALMDANDRAIGTLIDANMEEESTRLKALQTQQQLAVQSLGIANSSSQNVLSLFR